MLKQGQDIYDMTVLAECMFHISEVVWLDTKLKENVSVQKKICATF